MLKFSKIYLLVIFIISSGVSFWYFKTYKKTDYNHMNFSYLPELKPIWERKAKTDQITKIGIITDTHVHPSRIEKKAKENRRDDDPRYLSDSYKDVFDEFNKNMSEFKPEFIVHLGDIIEGTNEEDFVGLMGLDLVEDELEKLEIPVYWVIGNHDLRSVTKEQFKKKFKLDSLDYYYDDGDYRFIFLDANYHDDGRESMLGSSSNNGFLPQETLDWLEPLLQTDKETFIFTHHPLEDETIKPILNADELRFLLEKYNSKAIFSGHIEWKYFKIENGLEMFSFPGTKKNLVHDDPFYELTIDGSETKVDMYYLDPVTAEEKEVDFKLE